MLMITPIEYLYDISQSEIDKSAFKNGTLS